MKVLMIAVAAMVCLVSPVRSANNPDSVAEGYAQLVAANYADAYLAALAMQNEINVFLDNPTRSGLLKAREAWLTARDVYGQTEVFRFYGGPIDGDNGPEGQINAWPMDESYVDYVQGQLASGLIGDKSFEISLDSLAAQNERGGEENIATGWHAIEFLLWGQDQSEIGAGSRSFEDFKGAGNSRRRTYLQTVTQLLVNDLNSVADQWRPDVKGNYRAQFVKGGQESIGKILIGVTTLSRDELVSERMEVALFSQEQEDEQSCFSDNTHNDIIANAQGVWNVWAGQYKRLDGSMLKVPSLSTRIANINQKLANNITNQIQNSVAYARKISAPFDQEIKGGRDGHGKERIQATIDSLVAQSDLLIQAADTLGLKRLTITE